MGERIPLVDLTAQHREIAEELSQGFSRVMETAAFILGPEETAFEEEYARFCGVRHCVGVGSGTDALELALRAMAIGPDSEVIVPVNTFAATAMAVVRAGAVPVFVDCDPDYHLLDVEKTSAALTPRTRAVIVVHLYGQLGPVQDLQSLCQAKGLILLEDAAQSHGALSHGTGAGGFGQAAATSFYPGKNLGAYGDAGAVLTDSDPIAEQIRALRNYGGQRRHVHAHIGFNSRLDSLQAVVLRAKLRRLPAWNVARRLAAQRYDALLGGIPGLLRPALRPGNESVWHLYVVRVPERDKVLRLLNEAGIEAAVHYPVPLHLQGAFAYKGLRRGGFPIAERAAEEILSLPLYPHITPAQQERVAAEIRRALN